MIYANIFQLGVLFWIPTWREQICSVDLRVCATSWMNVSDLQAKFCFCGIIVLVFSFTDFVETLETCSWNMFYTVYLGGLPIISCHDYPKTLSGCSVSPLLALWLLLQKHCEEDGYSDNFESQEHSDVWRHDQNPGGPERVESQLGV